MTELDGIARVDHDLLSGTFGLRRLEPDRDLDLVHSWMNDPEVARFWKMAWTRQRIGDYLHEQDESACSTSYLGVLNDVAMSYWELYRADRHPLSEHYAARDHDAGVHLLIGPSTSRGRGLATHLLRLVAGWQLAADPLANRVVAEPDVANERSIRAFERAGFRRAGVLNLPEKRAALMVRDRG